MRIVHEIISSIKKTYPQLILSIRFPGQDLLEGGITKNEAIEIAKNFEQIGVDLLNVSSGMGGWRRPKTRRGEGYLVEDAHRLKQNVKIPVIGVGGIKTIDYIEKILQSQQVDLVAVGREILTERENFKKRYFMCA